MAVQPIRPQAPRIDTPEVRLSDAIASFAPLSDRGFDASLVVFPANVTIEEIAEEVTGYDMKRFGPLDHVFDVSQNASSLSRELERYGKGAGARSAFNHLRDAYGDVFNGRVTVLSHDKSEDGDADWRIAITKRPDGSQLAFVLLAQPE